MACVNKLAAMAGRILRLPVASPLPAPRSYTRALRTKPSSQRYEVTQWRVDRQVVEGDRQVQRAEIPVLI